MDLGVTLQGKVEASKTSGFYTNTLSKIDAEKDPKKIGTEFEAIFYRMMLKEMRESELFEDEIFGGHEMNTYKEMRDDELANILASRGDLGIVKLVMDHIEERSSKDVVNPEDFGEVFSSYPGLIKEKRG